MPATWLWCVYSAVQFPVYHAVKSWDEAHFPGGRTVQGFLAGAAASVTATFASHPFDVLRTVLAAQGEPKVSQGHMTQVLLHDWGTSVTVCCSGVPWNDSC